MQHPFDLICLINYYSCNLEKKCMWFNWLIGSIEYLKNVSSNIPCEASLERSMNMATRENVNWKQLFEGNGSGKIKYYSLYFTDVRDVLNFFRSTHLPENWRDIYHQLYYSKWPFLRGCPPTACQLLYCVPVQKKTNKANFNRENRKMRSKLSKRQRNTFNNWEFLAETYRCGHLLPRIVISIRKFQVRYINWIYRQVFASKFTFHAKFSPANPRSSLTMLG